MWYGNWYRSLGLVVLSAGLGTGCGSSHLRQASPRESGQVQAVPAKPNSTWPEEKLAQAHAHYGAGVIHEMNDEEDAALSEYRLAALNDPENEQLVMEVSRRRWCTTLEAGRSVW